MGISRFFSNRDQPPLDTWNGSILIVQADVLVCLAEDSGINLANRSFRDN